MAESHPAYDDEQTLGAAEHTAAHSQTDDQTIDRPSGTAATVRAESPARLPTVEGYELLEVLGRGGMGVVYKARQTGLKRIVALKMILAGGHAGEVHLARFRAEAESAARLQHPNIVQVYEVGESGGFPFFSQEFVAGGTLSQRLSGAPQPARPAAELMAMLADAIEYAHEKGVVHRDLKPANILLTTEGVSVRDENSAFSHGGPGSSRSAGSGSNVLSPAQAYRFGIPKIADFGLAKQLDDQSGRTASGSILGTPSYMAPEQAGGRTHEIGPSVDTYALGAILYELLTGRPPFRGESSLETLEQVRTQEPVAPRQLQPKIPPDLETICLKCLGKERSHRYPSTGALAADLRAFLDGRPIAARPASVLERGWRWCRRKPWTAAFLAASLLVVAALFVGAWYRQQLLQSQQFAKASDELARTEKYYSLVNSARELAAAAPLGWTWRASDEIEEAAKSPSRLVDRAELRSLAADFLTRFDVREPAVLAKGVAPSELAFRPDASTLAIAENKNALLLSVHEFNTLTHERSAVYSIATLSTSLERLMQGTGAYQEGITALAYSPDKRWLCVGTRFGRLGRWDLAEKEPRPILWQAYVNRAYVRGLAFTPDSTALISGSEESGLKMWQISADWKETPLLPEVTAVFDVKLMESRILAVAAGNRLRLYPTQGTRPLATEPEDIYARRLSATLDGRFIAAKSNSTVRIVETRTGREIRVLALPEEDSQASAAPRHHANDSQFSPDGAFLATAWVDKRVRVWDVASGRIVATLSVPGDSDPLSAFSPDGRLLAVAAERQTLVYELRMEDIQTTIAHQAAAVQAIEFTTDRKSLLTNADRGYPGGIADNLLAWWNVDNGELQRESLVEGYRGSTPVRFTPLGIGLAMHPQGKFVAASSAMMGTRLVSSTVPSQRSGLAEIPGDFGAIEVAESELERSESSSNVEVRNDPQAVDGKAIRISAGQGGREALAAVPSKLHKATDTRTGLAVYAAIRVESRGNVGPAFAMNVVSPNRRDTMLVDLARLPDDGYHWHLIDVFPAKDVKAQPTLRFSIGTPEQPGDLDAVWVDRLVFIPFKIRDWATDLQVFPQGPLAFSPGGRRLWGILDEEQVVGWNAPELTVAARWDASFGTRLLGKFLIQSLSAGEKWVVAGSSTGDTFVLAAATGKLTKNWRDEGRSIRSVSLDPSEESAAIGMENGGLRVVRIPSGEQVTVLEGHREAVESLAYSADGKLLVSGSHDRTVRIWRRQAEEFELLVTLPAGGRVRSVRLTPDATKLAVLVESERAVRIWHLDRLNERLRKMGLGW